ncbi:MAG: cytochrome c [Candidatus Coatesbacteria bacterium]
MPFQAWAIPWLGNELPRAVVGYLFAVACYFTVGASLLMVVLEHRAQREGNQFLLSFLQDWSRFILLMTTVLGLVLAAGAWLVAAVTEPAAVFVLTRVLFWVWGILWVLAGLALCSGLLHYSGWGAVAPGHHLVVGWVMAGCAWGSLFVVNGILAFLLDPGAWLETGRLLDGFFNATFNPSLLVHAGLALGIGGLFTLVAGAETDPPRLRSVLVRTASWFALAGFTLAPVGEAWQVAVMPPAAREALFGPSGHGPGVFAIGPALAILIVAFLATGPLVRTAVTPRPLAFLLLLLGLAAAGVSGWSREAARAPWVISGYLQVNGLGPREANAARVEGFLRRARYARSRTTANAAAGEPASAGQELFRFQCGCCHTTTGVRGLRRIVQGWDVETIDHQLGRLEKLRGVMPAFAGTDAERRALARWLASLAVPKGGKP